MIEKNSPVTSSGGSRQQWEELNSLITSKRLHDVIIALNSNARDVDVNFRDAACGLQTIPMRLCHIEVSNLEAKAQVFSKLLEKNCDFCTTDGGERTLLHHVIISQCCHLLAILKQQWNAVSMLNLCDVDGNSPLHACVATAHEETTREFLETFEDSKIEFQLRNKQGE